MKDSKVISSWSGTLLIAGAITAIGLTAARRSRSKASVVRLIGDDSSATIGPGAGEAPLLQAAQPLLVRLLAALPLPAGTEEEDATADPAGGKPDHSKLLANNLLSGFPRRGVRSQDRTVPGTGAAIPIRIYTPERAAEGERPLVLYVHGGGWALGNLDMCDWLAGTVARDLDAVVVAVDYRLVPDHPFPAGLDDCFDALKWCAANARVLGAASGRIGVVGESAGGNLSAVLCLLARDAGVPRIDHQALIYPAVDLRAPTRSRDINRNAPVLNRDALDTFERNYIGRLDPQKEWRLSPLHAPSKERLPPALIQIAGYDPLHDDGLKYAQALRAADVPVTLTVYSAMPHGYVNLPYLLRESRRAMREVVKEQRKYLRQSDALTDTRRFN